MIMRKGTKQSPLNGTGFNYTDWLRHEDLMNGIVAIDEAIDEDCASRVLSEINALVRNGSKEVTIQISSPGGGAYYAFAIYDAIRQLSERGIGTKAIVTGWAASAAAMIVLQAADERLSYPSARFLLHEARRWIFFAVERTSDLKDELQELDAITERIIDILALRCKRTREEIRNRIDRQEIWMSATEAQKWGLIDGIVQDGREAEIKKAKAAESEGGSIDFKEDMEGDGVLQLHAMGLSEEDAGKGNYTGSCHLDIRLHPKGKNYWEGGEIFIGNRGGLKKLTEYKEGQKLRFAWKQLQSGDRKNKIVRGALSWMKAGKGERKVFSPGEAGALAKTWAAIEVLESFTWKAGKQDTHFKEFVFEGGKHLNGRWIFSSVPVGEGKRVWMASRPAKQELESGADEG